MDPLNKGDSTNQHEIDPIMISGWWYTYPSEKYESQWKGLSHILWKIKNVPNHQPAMIFVDVPRLLPSIPVFRAH
jgi:hypothetical protein